MIQDQLHRVLDSAQFRSSRRCCSFLQYVVRQATSGHADHLKERTIGIEVFGRDPDYDTNHDPVVRGTASEIRKRLAQYYQVATHADELRINLASGSYLPEFHIPVKRNDPVSGIPSEPVLHVVPVAPEPVMAAPAVVKNAGPISRYWFLGSVALLLVASLAALMIRRSGSEHNPWLDQFWAPILSDSGPVLLCVGQPTVFNILGNLREDVVKAQRNLDPARLAARRPEDRIPANVADFAPNSDRYLALGDAMCLSELAAFLAKNHHSFHVRGGSSTSFADLRDNTSILIGGYTNDWTMRMTRNLRFSFADDIAKGAIYVQDRKNTAERKWQVQNYWPDWKIPVDYAIVSRIQDPETGRVLVTAAGITHYGTAAAGEFLTNPKYLTQALEQAPKGWQQKSLEVVLATRVIGGTAGPPQVLATQFQ